MFLKNSTSKFLLTGETMVINQPLNHIADMQKPHQTFSALIHACLLTWLSLPYPIICSKYWGNQRFWWYQLLFDKRGPYFFQWIILWMALAMKYIIDAPLIILSIVNPPVVYWSRTHLSDGKAVVRTCCWTIAFELKDLNEWSGTHYLWQRLWIVNPLCPTQKWGVRIRTGNWNS